MRIRNGFIVVENKIYECMLEKFARIIFLGV